MTTAALVLFVLSAGLMLHTYFFYPLTLYLFPRRFRNPPDTKDWTWPRVAILVPAYNEEKVIAAKIENSLALDYDKDKIEILIGSDGSRDRTNEIVRNYAKLGVRLIELPGRSGKTGVLNRLVHETSAEILIITDANVDIAPDALKKIIRHFHDPKVGVVGAGKYVRIPLGAESVQGERIYAQFVNKLKKVESDIGGMSGCLGSLIAMRGYLYEPYTPGPIDDDIVPCILAVKSGYRVAYDPSARAVEDSADSLSEEFRRRIRIGSANFRTLFKFSYALSPRRPIVAYTYFSHKVIRWIFPFLMLVALISNFFLLDYFIFRLTLLGQIVFYGFAFAGAMFNMAGVRAPVFSLLYHFVALNTGLLLGFFAYLRGIKTSAWEPTQR